MFNNSSSAKNCFSRSDLHASDSGAMCEWSEGTRRVQQRRRATRGSCEHFASGPQPFNVPRVGAPHGRVGAQLTAADSCLCLAFQNEHAHVPEPQGHDEFR
eukprot:9629152-Alexandrium_andersonii.AAC.1